MSENQYVKLGVDPDKKSVRQIFESITDNEYKGAFVNIVTDPFCKKRVMTQHQDGDGSKFVQRLIHYFESGDKTVFRGMVDDALSMNTGDIAASGFVFFPYLVTDVLNVNFPKDLKKIIMKQVAIRFTELKKIYADHGINIKLLGGETADLPDQVRSGVFDITVTAWAEKGKIITGNTQDEDIIYGFPSDGRAAWETVKNSGIMSNGLTMARSCLMHSEYNKKYPNLKREENFYKGSYHYNDPLSGVDSASLDGMTVGGALISPTRQWALVIRTVIDSLKSVNALHMLHGISMNTGGGATKIRNVGRGGVRYIKSMPFPPPLFRLIQSASKESWRNMFKNFNCGIGIDIIGENHLVFREALERAAAECHLLLHRLGRCQKLPGQDRENQVWLNTIYGNFRY
jgi:phosphoribosylformylglycinamidine cyclo-ligase